VQASSLEAQATFAELGNVRLTVQAEVAVDYFQLRVLDGQKQLLDTAVQDYEESLKLTQDQANSGMASGQDVEQAATLLDTTRAQATDLGIQRALLEHAIATLLGRPASTFAIAFRALDLKPVPVPVGVPSQLLERRPDIAASERRVAAANAQIGIAVSAFYPTISLNGIGGFESEHGVSWIQGPSALWSLGAQATELIFDAGKRHALTDQARHAYEAQVAAYRSQVLLAFNDVEDQLSGLRILEQESAAEQKAVASAQHSYEISNLRYRGGVTSYLEVLTAEAALLQNQHTAIDLKTRQFAASVGLVRSLGGGWDASQLPK
jgi:NodT family efflux transporter outer membrane factor (OMF) lipoprotein